MSSAEVLRGNLAMDWVLRAALEAHAAQRLPAQAGVCGFCWSGRVDVQVTYCFKKDLVGENSLKHHIL